MEEKRKTDRIYEKEIDLEEIFFLIKHNLIWILLAAVLGGVLTGAYFKFMVQPTYKATSKVYVVSASKESVINLSDLQLATNLKADYEELLLSRPVMNSVLQNLSLEGKETVESLRGRITIDNPENTRILVISVTHTDPQSAADIANEMAELSVSWLPAVMESNQPHIVEDAVVPTHKEGPNISKNALTGAAAFAMIVVGILLARYYLKDTISSAEDMEHYFDMTPLTIIPYSEELEAAGSATGKKRKHGK